MRASVTSVYMRASVTFRTFYAGPDDRDKKMKFRVPILYFFSSVFIFVSMLVPPRLLFVRVVIWTCTVLMSLFATVLFLFSLADVQRYMYDPKIMMKQRTTETEGKVKRMTTMSEARSTRLVGGVAQRDIPRDKRIWISVFAALLVSYLPFLSDGSCPVEDMILDPNDNNSLRSVPQEQSFIVVTSWEFW